MPIPANYYYSNRMALQSISVVAICNILKVSFQNRLISRLWEYPYTPRSPDLTPLDVFLWGYIKENCFREPQIPTTINELKTNVEFVSRNIDQQSCHYMIERICSKCTISCICMRWGLYFAFRSLRTCTEWHLSLGLPWGYVGLRVVYVLIRRHHVFRLGSLIGLRSGGASRLAWCLGSSW